MLLATILGTEHSAVDGLLVLGIVGCGAGLDHLLGVVLGLHHVVLGCGKARALRLTGACEITLVVIILVILILSISG